MSIVGTLLVLLFPGSLLSLRKEFFPSLHFIEKIPLYIICSFIYWIVGFWWLRYIPIPLSTWIILTIGLSAATWVYLWITTDKTLRPRRLPSVSTIIFGAIVLIPQIILLLQQRAPSGQDMSMHAYIAAIITNINTFPRTLSPLIPVNQFGLYPFGFSTLVAVLSTINQLPIFTNALIMTAVVHALFDSALYILLRSKFTPFVSAFTALIVAWTSHNPHLFVEWGANPSVLSFAFLIISIAMLLQAKSKKMTILAICALTASLLTNYMYVITLGYMLVGVGIVSFPYIRQHFRRQIASLALGLVVGCVLLSPFIHTYASYHGFALTEEVIRYIQGLHHNETDLWNGTFTPQGLWGIIEIIAETIDHKLLAFYALCILLLFSKKKLTAYLHVIQLFTVTLLVVNARFWWLPFSSLLYPQRIILILLIPISWIIAETLHAYRSQKHGILPTTIGCVLLLLMVLQLRQFQFTSTSRHHQLVTDNDITVLMWLKQHSEKTDIIWNRYEDAGVWIPAIIYRPITIYHTNPVDKYALMTVVKKAPRFAFIGEAVPQQGNIRDLVGESYPSAENWQFTLLYSRGNAAVYRIDQ